MLYSAAVQHRGVSSDVLYSSGRCGTVRILISVICRVWGRSFKEAFCASVPRGLLSHNLSLLTVWPLLAPLLGACTVEKDEEIVYMVSRWSTVRKSFYGANKVSLKFISAKTLLT